jgi:hypothetical protein
MYKITHDLAPMQTTIWHFPRNAFLPALQFERFFH